MAIYNRNDVLQFVEEISNDPEINAEMLPYKRRESHPEKERRLLALRCGFWFFGVLHTQGVPVEVATPLCELFARNSVVNEPIGLALHYGEQFEAYGEIRIPSLIEQSN